MIDLEGFTVEADEQLAAVHRMHLDAGARLIVTDDVDLPGDQADFELAHAIEVDDLLAFDEPFLLDHFAAFRAISRCVELKLYRVSPQVKLYREFRCDSPRHPGARDFPNAGQSVIS